MKVPLRVVKLFEILRSSVRYTGDVRSAQHFAVALQHTKKVTPVYQNYARVKVRGELCGTIHAEQNLLHHLPLRRAKINILVFRTGRATESKPCCRCIELMKLCGRVNNVYYSDRSGALVGCRLRDLYSDHKSGMTRFINRIK